MKSDSTPTDSMSQRQATTVAPLRIYVLWHPGFVPGAKIAQQIYQWFRLENMEGTPVFFRSTAGIGLKLPTEIPADCRRNYVLPLVEANMAADPGWRRYVALMVDREDIALFPVALDPLAYQMPANLRGYNFIRHDCTQTPPPSTEILLGQLTEVFCRDLRFQVLNEHGNNSNRNKRIPSKIKLFLSHAKAAN